MAEDILFCEESPYIFLLFRNILNGSGLGLSGKKGIISPSRSIYSSKISHEIKLGNCVGFPLFNQLHIVWVEHSLEDYCHILSSRENVV